MSMPSWDAFMVPALKLLSDGRVRTMRELRQELAETLTEEQREERLPSGHSKAENRIGWAASYLTRVGALERPRRGEYSITDVGRRLLAEHPDGISGMKLREYARDGDEWWTTKRTEPTELPVETDLDPIEQIEEGIARVHDEVAAELLSRMQGKDPDFFEQAVVDLLVAMGYGGAEGRATVTGASNDGGIDGIIDQDTLGLNRVYVQAKRYGPGSHVQRPELQAFVGALSGRADGGVFITRSKFSQGARTYAEVVPTRLILIDGERLTRLMIRFGVGVRVQQTHHIVEVDEDFFE